MMDIKLTTTMQPQGMMHNISLEGKSYQQLHGGCLSSPIDHIFKTPTPH
jgi:hypothetical protein